MAKKTYVIHYSKKDIAIAMLVVFILAFGLGFSSNDLAQQFSKDFSSFKNSTPIVGERQAEITVVAVTEDGAGVIGKANIEVVSGRGRTLINTNPFIEADTQFSAETAISYAINYTGVDISNHDVIVSFKITDIEGTEIDSRGQIIGGPSAGAALSIATIAALEGKKIKDDVAITGTIEEDGIIGKVGSVVEKADAAGQAGIKIFLVPADQAVIKSYERVVTNDKSGQFTIKRIRYIPTSISLNNHTVDNWNMTSIEVSTVEEALNYAVE